MTNQNNLNYLINFILNGFLHITLLFIFLTVLYYYIISPLTMRLLHENIGNLIDNTININFPEPIQVNFDTFLKKYINNQTDSQINNQLNNQNINLSQILDNLKYQKIVPKEQFWSDNTIDVKINNNSMTNVLNSPSNIPDNLIKIINNYKLNNLLSNSPSLSNEFKIFKEKYINPFTVYNLIEQNTTPDNIIMIHNETVIYYAIYISVCLLLITILLIAAFKYVEPDSVNVSHILLENFLTFSILGGIEYWFFINYAFKYYPLLPSEMLHNINTITKEKLSHSYSNTDTIPQYSEKLIEIKLS